MKQRATFYVITDNEIERIESMLSMVNLAVSEIIENGRVKGLPEGKRKNVEQSRLTETADRSIWECLAPEEDTSLF